MRTATDNIALYNCEAFLWENMPAGSKVRLVDGMLHQDKEGWLARFRNNEHAADILTQAGWECKGRDPRMIGKIWVKKGDGSDVPKATLQ